MAVVALVMTGAGGLLTVNVKVMFPVPPELVALKSTLEVPAMVGAPVIKPVAVFKDKPTGSPVALKLVGLLMAVVW